MENDNRITLENQIINKLKNEWQPFWRTLSLAQSMNISNVAWFVENVAHGKNRSFYLNMNVRLDVLVPANFIQLKLTPTFRAN